MTCTLSRNSSPKDIEFLFLHVERKMGFEPTTPALVMQCSDQTELFSRLLLRLTVRVFFRVITPSLSPHYTNLCRERDSNPRLVFGIDVTLIPPLQQYLWDLVDSNHSSEETDFTDRLPYPKWLLVPNF